ncbi:MAG: cyclodeaminase/cyclohydrolase family protein [Anaerolineae bacterium]|nr:cyclodeaminase/cyclohydrolase family protein [Anaerolineae bacterium]
MFTDLKVNEFLDALASKDAVPGGGSGAALAGALGAALVSMVCNLTIGKKGYEDAWEPLTGVRERSEALRARIVELLEADTRAYAKVMEAYRMQRGTDKAKAARKEAMQAALRHAAEVPLQIAESCGEVVDLALPAAEMGNRWAVSDAGVGALLAEAAMHAALLNVKINLASIDDAAYVQATRDRISAMTEERSRTKDRVQVVVAEAIKG